MTGAPLTLEKHVMIAKEEQDVAHLHVDEVRKALNQFNRQVKKKTRLNRSLRGLLDANGEPRHHWVAWSRICLPVEEGGLGIQSSSQLGRILRNFCRLSQIIFISRLEKFNCMKMKKMVWLGLRIYQEGLKPKPYGIMFDIKADR
ncbi:unnamed protein product [Dovyalis caffra]|uniref:Uncharacterized protein n=1 Tax=Dovyalis caffra TaxID=77055 RepID=A0AAV1QWF5_9ROSI|nr:unnamed protein product [Dovyalis caffra]